MRCGVETAAIPRRSYLRRHARATSAETGGVAYLKEGVRRGVKKRVIGQKETITKSKPILGEGGGGGGGKGFREQSMARGGRIHRHAAPPNTNLSRGREDKKIGRMDRKKSLLTTATNWELSG